MPGPLKNSRHEAFAQHVADGVGVKLAGELSGVDIRECSRPATYYVYFLADGRDDAVFYVGKGKGNRYRTHCKEWRNVGETPAKNARIAEIIQSGSRVVAYCLEEGLPESAAYDLERDIIRRIGRDRLTNNQFWLSGLERAVSMAKVGLASLKPRHVVVSENGPAWELAQYDKIVSRLKSIIRGDWGTCLS